MKKISFFIFALAMSTQLSFAFQSCAYQMKVTKIRNCSILDVKTLTFGDTHQFGSKLPSTTIYSAEILASCSNNREINSIFRTTGKGDAEALRLSDAYKPSLTLAKKAMRSRLTVDLVVRSFDDCSQVIELVQESKPTGPQMKAMTNKFAGQVDYDYIQYKCEPNSRNPNQVLKFAYTHYPNKTTTKTIVGFYVREGLEGRKCFAEEDR